MVKYFIILVVVVFLSIHPIIQSAEIPSYSVEKINEIPDLCQADDKANFPGGGNQYCCLAAISNSLMWLDRHGFPDLVADQNDVFTSQVALVNILAGPGYMNTDSEDGTGTSNIIRGLKKYIEQRGYSIRRLDYQGWRKTPAEITVSEAIPLLRWIQEGIIGKSSVWLNIGWYSYDPVKRDYARFDGHWVTLVGYGQDKDKKPDPQILILHDPSLRTGSGFSNQYVKVGTVQQGRLSGNWAGLPRDAGGYLYLKEGIPLKRGADYAIIDGALLLSLNEPNTPLKSRENVPNDSDKEILIGHTGRGVILKEPSRDVAVKEQLSKEEQIDNFEILSRAIDRYYSFFEIKKIDWETIAAAYRNRIEHATSTENYYSLLYQFVKELKDTHSRLYNYTNAPELEPYSPPAITAWIEEQVVVTAVNNASKAYREGLRPGCVIQSVNGTHVTAYLNKLRPYFDAYSSERIYYHNAAIKILCGGKGSQVQFKFVPYGSKQIQTMKVVRSVRLPKDPAAEPSFSISKGSYIWYGRTSENYGYIRIVTFSDRNDIADEFDTAMESLRDTEAILLDIRDNPGGFGTSHKRIIGRLITKTTPGVIMYRRNGPQHSDFEKTQNHYEPVGSWQYTRPLGLLMNTVTGSASDLFAAALIGADRVIAMGQPTHGNSSGDCVYIQLPCNLIVRISCCYLCNARGKVTEVSGNQPQVPIEPCIEDIIQNKDGVLERALDYLKTH